MAKTISQSLTSLESTESNLTSSLRSCKTSIQNKGVSVPSSTTFSGLPALIDKINTTPTHTISFSSISDKAKYTLTNGAGSFGTLDTRQGIPYGSKVTFSDLKDNNEYFIIVEKLSGSALKYESAEVNFKTNQELSLRSTLLVFFFDCPKDIENVYLGSLTLNKGPGYEFFIEVEAFIIMSNSDDLTNLPLKVKLESGSTKTIANLNLSKYTTKTEWWISVDVTNSRIYWERYKNAGWY